MPRDATLDEFATAGPKGDASTTSEDAESPPVEPTMTWTPEPVACSRCEEPTNRVWFDDGDAVCPDCKPW